MLGQEGLELIENNVKEMLDPLGFALVELKYFKVNNGIILRFLIDRIEGGITIEECAQLNKRISQFMDEKNIIDARYTLEVSSPGIDRSLVKVGDFKRVLNKRIHIFLKEPQNQKLELEGILTRLDSERIYLINDERLEIAVELSKINKAKQTGFAL